MVKATSLETGGCSGNVHIGMFYDPLATTTSNDDSQRFIQLMHSFQTQ